MQDETWSEKYRPKTVDEAILPKEIKDKFNSYIAKGSLPNMVLSGPSGTGKSAVARAAVNAIGSDYLFINGSLNVGIDKLRNDITNFASTISFYGGKKYIIIDEADGLDKRVQVAFRAFIEQYDSNCGFIFTCNYKNKLLPALISRFAEIDFNVVAEEKAGLAAKFMKRTAEIMDAEGVTYDKKILAQVIMRYYPDFRKVLVEIQAYIKDGKNALDAGIFASMKHIDVNLLFDFLKNKDFDSMRQWVAENSDQDMNSIFREIYDSSKDRVENRSLPNMVILLAEYQYKDVFVADPEINMVACLTELMMELDFK